MNIKLDKFSIIGEKAEKIGQFLTNHRLSLATAESCTGGGVSYALTSVPGASNWFERGFVVYSNLAKENLLSIPYKLILEFGAVSKEVALKMAQGALQHSKADLSIAVTGIAGPDGGSPEKPVGTVWFAIGLKNRPEKLQSYHQVFSGDRQAVREKSILFILQALDDFLLLI